MWTCSFACTHFLHPDPPRNNVTVAKKIVKNSKISAETHWQKILSFSTLLRGLHINIDGKSTMDLFPNVIGNLPRLKFRVYYCCVCLVNPTANNLRHLPWWFGGFRIIAVHVVCGCMVLLRIRIQVRMVRRGKKYRTYITKIIEGVSASTDRVQGRSCNFPEEEKKSSFLSCFLPSDLASSIVLDIASSPLPTHTGASCLNGRSSRMHVVSLVA